MIIRLAKGAPIHKNRSFSDLKITETEGDELAETTKGVMRRDGVIERISEELDAKILTGPYKNYWTCISKHGLCLASPLLVLALEAE